MEKSDYYLRCIPEYNKELIILKTVLNHVKSSANLYLNKNLELMLKYLKEDKKHGILIVHIQITERINPKTKAFSITGKFVREIR